MKDFLVQLMMLVVVVFACIELWSSYHNLPTLTGSLHKAAVEWAQSKAGSCQDKPVVPDKTPTHTKSMYWLT